jgi:hypothetical protein
MQSIYLWLNCTSSSNMRTTKYRAVVVEVHGHLSWMHEIDIWDDPSTTQHAYRAPLDLLSCGKESLPASGYEMHWLQPTNHFREGLPFCSYKLSGREYRASAKQKMHPSREYRRTQIFEVMMVCSGDRGVSSGGPADMAGYGVRPSDQQPLYVHVQSSTHPAVNM